ncbi:MAG: 50S ribosomal protein L19, partial [Parachlamydiales bacterium]
LRSGKVCRSKLTYIRGRAGKAAKIQEKIGFYTEAPLISQEGPIDTVSGANEPTPPLNSN